MINTQNGEDCKTFFDRLNLDRRVATDRAVAR